MLPTSQIRFVLATLFSADTGTIAPAASACKAHLIKVPFTPGDSLDFGTLTEATFTGGAAKSAGTGTQSVMRDPDTNSYIVEILEPAGGWKWICTVAPSSPETIYGVVFTNNAGTQTYGGVLLPTPVTIGA